MIRLIEKAWTHRPVRYAFSAGIATITDFVVFYWTFHYLFSFQFVRLGGFHLSKTTLCLVGSYSLGFLVNFILSKWLVFTESHLRTRVQLFRFFLVAVLVFIGNYLVLKTLVEFFMVYPTLARVFSALVIAAIGFWLNKVFAFRIPKHG